MVALSDRNLAAYHGVEHRAIGAYEAGSDDPASATKEHERCGSNLVAPMIVLSAAGQLLLERSMDEPGPLARAWIASLAVHALDGLPGPLIVVCREGALPHVSASFVRPEQAAAARELLDDLERAQSTRLARAPVAQARRPTGHGCP